MFFNMFFPSSFYLSIYLLNLTLKFLKFLAIPKLKINLSSSFLKYENTQSCKKRHLCYLDRNLYINKLIIMFKEEFDDWNNPLPTFMSNQSSLTNSTCFTSPGLW